MWVPWLTFLGPTIVIEQNEFGTSALEALKNMVSTVGNNQDVLVLPRCILTVFVGFVTTLGRSLVQKGRNPLGRLKRVSKGEEKVDEGDVGLRQFAALKLKEKGMQNIVQRDPLPEGWTVKTTTRRGKNRSYTDSRYRDPAGKIYRSRKEVDDVLSGKASSTICSVCLHDFSHKEPLARHTRWGKCVAPFSSKICCARCGKGFSTIHKVKLHNKNITILKLMIITVTIVVLCIETWN